MSDCKKMKAPKELNSRQSRKAKKELVASVNNPVEKWDVITCEKCGMEGSRILDEEFPLTRTYKCNCGHKTKLRAFPWNDSVDEKLDKILNGSKGNLREA